MHLFICNVCILDIVVNGPREPGVGAELIDTCQKRENEFNAPDSRKISSIRYNQSGNNEKLHNIEVSKIQSLSLTVAFFSPTFCLI